MQPRGPQNGPLIVICNCNFPLKCLMTKCNGGFGPKSSTRLVNDNLMTFWFTIVQCLMKINLELTSDGTMIYCSRESSAW